jgi:hypothetical protein
MKNRKFFQPKSKNQQLTELDLFVACWSAFAGFSAMCFGFYLLMTGEIIFGILMLLAVVSFIWFQYFRNR